MINATMLIGKIAALVPPPRSHRHRYFGVLAPNSPLRAAVIALAPVAIIATSLLLADSAGTEDKPRRAVSHYLWATPVLSLSKGCLRASTKRSR